MARGNSPDAYAPSRVLEPRRELALAVSGPETGPHRPPDGPPRGRGHPSSAPPGATGGSTRVAGRRGIKAARDNNSATGPAPATNVIGSSGATPNSIPDR